MLGNEDLTIPKKTIFGALALLVALLFINHFTGIFTKFHLENEETMVMEHGVDTRLYKEMLAELIEDTTADEHWERKIAAVEIGHLGPGATQATPALEKLLEDETPDVRAEAAIALARIGSHSGKAVSALIEVLMHGSDHEKYLAVNALGLIGADAKAAIPQLTIESRDDQPDIRAAAVAAMEKINVPAQ